MDAYFVNETSERKKKSNKTTERETENIKVEHYGKLKMEIKCVKFVGYL